MNSIGQNHESFMALFADLPESERRRIKWAYIISKDAHRSFNRKTGERYFEHPRSVALILYQLGIRNSNVICAGLLHDTPEDTRYFDIEDVRQMFGGYTALLVDAVTKRPDEGNEYYARLKREEDPLVFLLKGADTLHNIRSLSGNDASFIRRQLAKAEGFVLPLLAKLTVQTYGGPLEKAAKELHESVRIEIAHVRHALPH